MALFRINPFLSVVYKNSTSRPFCEIKSFLSWAYAQEEESINIKYWYPFWQGHYLDMFELGKKQIFKHFVMVAFLSIIDSDVPFSFIV